MSFSLAHYKREGKPAHPDDVYIHCGCKRCDTKFRNQARAYYQSLKDDGIDISWCDKDRWFPPELK